MSGDRGGTLGKPASLFPFLLVVRRLIKSGRIAASAFLFTCSPAGIGYLDAGHVARAPTRVYFLTVRNRQPIADQIGDYMPPNRAASVRRVSVPAVAATPGSRGAAKLVEITFFGQCVLPALVGAS